MVSVIKEDEGTMVPRAEMNIANGQYGRSVNDANTDNSEFNLFEVEAKDSIESETLQSVSVRTQPMGLLDVSFQEDSSDLGSLVSYGANGLRDGDLATTDLKSGHIFINHEDLGMMMNVHELEHVGTRAEHVGDRAMMSGSKENHGWAESHKRPCHPPRTSRLDQLVD